MVDHFKFELDELMGVNRNAAVHSKLRKEHYYNSEVISLKPKIYPNLGL